MKTITAIREEANGIQMRPLSSYEDIRRAWIEDLSGVCSGTKDIYGRNLDRFNLWVDETDRAWNCLRLADINRYLDHLKESHLSVRTIASYLTALKMFFSWAESEKLYPNIAASAKLGRAPKNVFVKQHLTKEDAQKLLSIEGLSLRDFAIINLMLRTGLRCIEISRLSVGSLDMMHGRRVLHVQGKGHLEADAEVILTDAAYQPISRYLASRSSYTANDPLFISESNHIGRHGRRLTTRTISGIVKAALRHIGIDRTDVTAHSLRHTTAVLILKAGGDLLDAQNALRHSSPSTTQIYVESIRKERLFEHAAVDLITL